MCFEYGQELDLSFFPPPCTACPRPAAHLQPITIASVSIVICRAFLTLCLFLQAAAYRTPGDYGPQKTVAAKSTRSGSQPQPKQCGASQGAVEYELKSNAALSNIPCVALNIISQERPKISGRQMKFKRVRHFPTIQLTIRVPSQSKLTVKWEGSRVAPSKFPGFSYFANILMLCQWRTHHVLFALSRMFLRYELAYRQAVAPEDMYLGMSGRNPSSGSCEEMKVTVHLPNTTFNQVQLDVLDKYLDVRTPQYRLNLHLPHPVSFVLF